MISELSETNNGNFMITLEDDTGTIKALVSINSQNKQLIEDAKNLVLDEVIGITGSMGNNIIFINSIIFPDIPLTKEFKKAPEEEYALFIGDIHFGSKYFLHKEFDRFKRWLKGEIGNDSQKELTKKIKYLFITGDLVEGVGIYPTQEKDLDVKDIYDQYQLFIDFVNDLPKYLNIIVCPGNHDAARIAEPQPPIHKKFVKELYERDNIFFVSSPSVVNIASTEDFSGLDVLIYHGYSFVYYADVVSSIREKGGQERVDLIMKFLLQKRHLAPSHTSTLYVPESTKDPLVIDIIPDFFVSGHIHRATYASYKNISLLNTSTWVGITDFQEKLGLKPQPAKVILTNLQTREMRMLNFEIKEKEESSEINDIKNNKENESKEKGDE
jgi:DNA polymerase II small subunit